MIEADMTQSVFDLVLARPVSLPGGEHDSLVHVWWSAASQGDRLVQVYVDDELTDVSLSLTQRSIWLMLDRTRAHRIELLAVPADDARGPWVNRTELLTSWSPPFVGRASVALMRDPALPIDTQLSVDVDGDTVADGAMWPPSEHRGGFGSLFGLGPFGADTATAPGLGLGELGMGPLGEGGTAWRWREPDLSPGPHTPELNATDGTGQPVAQSLSLPGVTIDALPIAPTQVAIDGDFTLRWSV